MAAAMSTVRDCLSPMPSDSSPLAKRSRAGLRSVMPVPPLARPSTCGRGFSNSPALARDKVAWEVRLPGETIRRGRTSAQIQCSQHYGNGDFRRLALADAGRALCRAGGQPRDGGTGCGGAYRLCRGHAVAGAASRRRAALPAGRALASPGAAHRRRGAFGYDTGRCGAGASAPRALPGHRPAAGFRRARAWRPRRGTERVRHPARLARPQRLRDRRTARPSAAPSPGFGQAERRGGLADMNVWLAAVLALLPPLAMAGTVALRAGSADRLVAVQLATSISILILVLMSFAFDQPSFIDVPLTLAFLSLPGTLIFAHFLERWL